MLNDNENLICKDNGRLFVGGKEFNSATSALVAYIDIFKNGAGTSKKQVPTYKREVGDLLLPKSCLQLTAERSLDSGVRDTTCEIQLFNRKKKIEKLHAYLLSVSATGDINSQADQTIKETEALLKDLQNGRTSPSSLCCFSDIGSRTTEYLLSASPYPPKANPIERDEKGVCKKCGNCSVKNPERSKQPIYQPPFEVEKMKKPVPLPMNPSSSKNSSVNVGKCPPSKEHNVVNKDACEMPESPSKIKNISEDRKKVTVDSVKAEISPEVEFRKAERLTCTKADWQNINSCNKSSGVITSTFNNCLSTKKKQLMKISDNVTPNKSERTPLVNQSKTKSEFPPHISSSGTKKRQNLPQSQGKQSLSENNFCKYVTSQTRKESGKFIKKIPKSKSSLECAAIKTLKYSLEEKDKQRTSENMSQSLKKKVNNIRNSQEIPHVPKKNISQNPSSNKQSNKLSKIMKSPNGSGTISKDIQHSPRCKQPQVSDFCDSKNLDSLPLNSSNNQCHTSVKSITPDAQEDHKKSITSPDVSHLSKYKNPQVPNWVKELELSRLNSPVPTDKLSFPTPIQQIPLQNLIESWSISGIPFASPEINQNQSSLSPQKDPECKCFENENVSPYQKLSEFITNFHTDPLLLDEDYDLPPFQNQSIQSLLDRYLNDQSKELSKLKSLDILTDEPMESFESRKPVDDSSFNHLCATHQSSRPLSPLSCEAVHDDPCFDENKEISKVPFTSSTPNRGQHCPCSNEMALETNPNPFWDDFEFQNGDDEHRCMETLKNMLFRLQGEEESVQSLSLYKDKSLSFSQSKEQKRISFPGIPQAKSYADDLQISSLSPDNAGPASFDKAFEHLHRLRAIVNGDQVPDL